MTKKNTNKITNIPTNSKQTIQLLIKKHKGKLKARE